LRPIFITLAAALASLVMLAASMSGSWFEREGRIVRGEIPSESGQAIVTDGAPRVDGRFTNRAGPGERAPLGVWGRSVARRIGAALRPRAGAAPHVPYDSAAIAHNPSLTWIGHATFLVRMDGVTFLTDPMFSNRASPVSFAGPPRLVPPGVPLEALPAVDFVLLSHDHYDHADAESVKQLAARGATFVVPLGLGEWVRRFGGTAVELDWWQELELKGIRVHSVPAQHFSGRSPFGLDRRLWSGWVVSGKTRRFFHAGDTGYSSDFARIGECLGPIDVAVVPIGAYLPTQVNHFVHTTPEEALHVGLDVRAGRIVAMHFGTFDLGDEPLDEPPQRFRAEAERLGLAPDRVWILNVGETRKW
jgi:N-acyl-phosphatidylethanolamine-hydrolysing phospholipase D